jgi:hypothetical protein
MKVLMKTSGHRAGTTAHLYHSGDNGYEVSNCGWAWGPDWEVIEVPDTTPICWLCEHGRRVAAARSDSRTPRERWLASLSKRARSRIVAWEQMTGREFPLPRAEVQS